MSYQDYLIFDREVDKLYEAKNFQTAIEFLETGFERFPDHEYEIAIYQAYCHRSLNQFDQALSIIEKYVQKGFFFDLTWEAWDPMRKLPGYKAINAESDRIKEEYQQNARLEYEVHLPKDYRNDQKYPVIFILHGDGNCCNIEIMKTFWTSQIFLEKNWITVYVQSSQVSCYKGFGWLKDLKITETDLRKCYTEVFEQYNFDSNEVCFGGFSGGSMASLHMVMNNLLPIKGVIALCPGKMESVTEESVRLAAERGVKAVILEGELSEDTDHQKTWISWFEKYGLKNKLIINKNTGHNYPEDLEEKLAQSLKFVIGD